MELAIVTEEWRALSVVINLGHWVWFWVWSICRSVQFYRKWSPQAVGFVCFQARRLVIQVISLKNFWTLFCHQLTQIGTIYYVMLPTLKQKVLNHDKFWLSMGPSTCLSWICRFFFFTWCVVSFLTHWAGPRFCYKLLVQDFSV